MYFDDLYVEPDYHKYGIGKSIFTAVTKYAKETDCKRIDAIALDSSPARLFFAKIGGINITSLEGWNLYKYDRQTIERFANDNK